MELVKKGTKGILRLIAESVVFSVIMGAMLLGSTYVILLMLQLMPYVMYILKYPTIAYMDYFHRIPSIYYQMFVAGFEDLVFVAPVLLAYKLADKIKRFNLMPLVYCLGITMSIWFALGHIYQGPVGMIVKVIYVPIAVLFAKKYGLSRTILGHSIFDIVITYIFYT